MTVLPSKPMPQPSFRSGDELGHYRLIEKIGRGGQAGVWRARDERLGRDVAIKILGAEELPDEATRERFRQEARAVGKLNHPNVATAYDFGNLPVDYLVTEYVPGAGLDEKLAAGALAEETVIRLGIQLTSGLEAAHRQGIIHRDLKPGNLRINQDGELKILDFGLAEMRDPRKDIASLDTVTLIMTITGTLPYMAPEQFGGFSDQRTDLWSAGAVLYEMATGKRPFPETQLQKLKDAILHKEPDWPRALNPAISPALERLILRCLQKDPACRCQTATDLREELAAVAQRRGVKSRDWLWTSGLAAGLLSVTLASSALTVFHFWPQIRARLWLSPPAAKAGFRVLAVLPIETGGSDSSGNALVRGVAETVGARLAQGTNGQKLQLIPPNELHAQGVTTAEAARREFGVDRLLAISLQRSGNRMRVTCNLIDTRTHQVVDARTLTDDANDLFSLEDNAVAEIFAMLPPDARSEQPTPTEVHAAEPAAYEFYVRGRGYLQDYQKAENIDAAIKEFQHALQVSPKYAPAYAGLGEAYWRGYRAHRGETWLDLAMTNCEKALAADQRLAEAHICLGSLYNDTGKYETAVAEFNRALPSENTSAQAFRGLGEAYDKLGKKTEAEATFKRAIAARPQYWAAYNWLGHFYFRQARYAEAIPMFQKVIELTPDNSYGYRNLGAMFVAEGRYDEAVNALQRSIELTPSLSAYSNLGAAYFWMHHYSDAIAAFEKARALDDQDYMNWGNLGDALYWSPGRRPEAAAAYKRAVELAEAQVQVNPRDATTLAYLADYSAMLGHESRAFQQLQQALTLAPKDAEVMFRAALVYNHFGDRPKTLDWLKRAADARYSRTVIRDTPDFDHLKSDSALKAIIAGA